jgi:hypothetical protein
MSVATKIRWRGTVSSRGLVSVLIPDSGDVVLVSRAGTKRWLVFRCPSGCGEEVPINLDPRSGPAWRIYNPGPYASLYPSVWRESGCEAHFILSRGRLWVFGLNQDDWEATPDTGTIDLVRQRLKADSQHYFDIAEALGLEPWDALMACRYLVRSCEASEESGQHRGRFRLV